MIYSLIPMYRGSCRTSISFFYSLHLQLRLFTSKIRDAYISKFASRIFKAEIRAVRFQNWQIEFVRLESELPAFQNLQLEFSLTLQKS